MPKAKFKPVISKIKLNPEQTVLWCECHITGYKYAPLWFPVYEGIICASAQYQGFPAKQFWMNTYAQADATSS